LGYVAVNASVWMDDCVMFTSGMLVAVGLICE